MSLVEQLEAKLAEAAAQGSRSMYESRERWVGVCLCGHLEDYHGAETGARREPDDDVIHGCRGATPRRNEPPGRYDPQLKVVVFEPTCPCTRFRHVADVDRPGRLFRQQLSPRDEIHPMTRGLKALTTRMTNAKMIDDPIAEVERRFRKIEERWVCRICKSDEEVWPMYVSDGRHSQMRCKNHTRDRAPSLYGPQQDAFSYEWK